MVYSCKCDEWRFLLYVGHTVLLCCEHDLTFFLSTQFSFGPCPKVHTDSHNIVASILSDKVVFKWPNCLFHWSQLHTCKFFGVFGAKPKQIIACLICCFFILSTNSDVLHEIFYVSQLNLKYHALFIMLLFYHKPSHLNRQCCLCLYFWMCIWCMLCRIVSSTWEVSVLKGLLRYTLSLYGPYRHVRPSICISCTYSSHLNVTTQLEILQTCLHHIPRWIQAGVGKCSDWKQHFSGKLTNFDSKMSPVSIEDWIGDSKERCICIANSCILQFSHRSCK